MKYEMSGYEYVHLSLTGTFTLLKTKLKQKLRFS